MRLRRDQAQRIRTAHTSRVVAAEAHVAIVTASVTDIGVARMIVITIDQVEVQGAR